MDPETDTQRFKRQIASFGTNQTWDEKTKQIAKSIRVGLNRQPPPTISQVQKESLKALPFKDQSRYQLTEQEISPPPEDDIRQALIEAVRGIEDVSFDMPETVPVQIEWTSQQSPSSSSQDNGNELVMLHFHGGGLFQSDPKRYRSHNAKLVSLTKGRVASVRYRLAPQHTFPAPLLDTFLVYLSLIYPPPAPDQVALNPAKIVLIGDSTGAVLVFGLLQIIRYLNSHPRLFIFHSRQIQFPIPMPAGCAMSSPAGEQLQALPSHRSYSVNDLYPPEIPWSSKYYPKCELWPANPPRQHIACDMDALRSSLNTPALARSWEGSPPMWFAVGEEQWYDGAKAVARRAVQSGVNLTWVEYQAMPHSFPIMPGFNKMRQTAHLMQAWADFCVRCVNGAESQSQTQRGQAKASRVSFKDLKETSIPLVKSSDLALEDLERIHEKRRQDDDRAWNEGWLDSKIAKL